MQYTVQDYLTDVGSSQSSPLAQNSSLVRETADNTDEEEDNDLEEESEEESTNEDETEDCESVTSSCEGSSGLEHSTKHQSVKRLSSKDGSLQPCAKKTKMVHQCQYCEFCADAASKLKRHLYKHTGERPFSCDKCNRRFSQLSNARKHMLTHTKAEYMCFACSKKFSSQKFLENHVAAYHVKQHVCDRCQAPYKTSKSLHQHIITKHICYKCCYCIHKFLSEEKLRTHSLAKHNKEQEVFVCGICSVKFPTCESLDRHFDDHELEYQESRKPPECKPVFSCAQCGHSRTFVSNINLQRHLMKFH